MFTNNKYRIAILFILIGLLTISFYFINYGSSTSIDMAQKVNEMDQKKLNLINVESNQNQSEHNENAIVALQSPSRRSSDPIQQFEEIQRHMQKKTLSKAQLQDLLNVDYDNTRITKGERGTTSSFSKELKN